MSTTPDDLTYFRVCFEGEELKFGVPTAAAREIAEAARKAVKKTKVSLDSALANGEKAIIDAFRKKLHRNSKASKKIAPFIISCCLLSNEAQENPEARGFILEISRSALPSWSTQAHESVPEEAPGKEPKTYAHYRAAAGRAEIDAFEAPPSPPD